MYIKIFFLITFFLCLFSLLPTFGQNIFKKYINGIINDTSDIREPQFLMYPTVAYSPETSWEIGFSSLYVYYPKKDTSNRLSELNAFTFFTLQNQYGLWLDHALYTDKDKWFFLGRLRFQSFPLKYHGVGMDSPAEYLALVEANQIMIKERILRQVRQNLFFGIEVDFQRLGGVEFKNSSENAIMDMTMPRGSQGSTNLGLGLGLVYDNRHNVLNVRKGLFSELAVLRYTQMLSDFSFTSILSDNRIYRPIGKNNVLAAQLLGQFNTGNVPFNQLALMGGDNMMRGYYMGRYRDKNLLAFQIEDRFLPLPLGFSKRIGAAVFGGLGTVFPDFQKASIHKVVWSAGAGLRFLLFPKKDIYTRFDIAYTQEGSGFYLFIGESF